MPDGVFVELHVGGAVAVVLQRRVARDVNDHKKT
jgi:hypothetical protein